MITLPKKIKLLGKKKIALVPSQRETQTESGLFLSTINGIHNYKKMIVVDFTDDIYGLKNGDEVIANYNKTKQTKLSGWSEELRCTYSIVLHIADEDDVLGVYED